MACNSLGPHWKPSEVGCLGLFTGLSSRPYSFSGRFTGRVPIFAPNVPYRCKKPVSGFLPDVGNWLAEVFTDIGNHRLANL